LVDDIDRGLYSPVLEVRDQSPHCSVAKRKAIKEPAEQIKFYDLSELFLCNLLEIICRRFVVGHLARVYPDHISLEGTLLDFGQANDFLLAFSPQLRACGFEDLEIGADQVSVNSELTLTRLGCVISKLGFQFALLVVLASLVASGYCKFKSTVLLFANDL
jgi:hypothetical protein